MVILVTAFAVGSVWSQDNPVDKNAKKPQPKPAQKKKGRQGPAIPEVDRDKVICFALYTVQDNVLKMSAQLYPLKDDESRELTLAVHNGKAWAEVGKTTVDENGFALFRSEDWNHSQDWKYQLTHPGGSKYTGIIRKDPKDKSEIIVAAFTGNSNSDRGPRPDIIANIKAIDPDLLFFSGDQSYDHRQHTDAWQQFGRQFGEIIKDRPTVTIPDDHDVGQGNLWGENGKVSKLGGGSDGGYTMPADYVKMVERAQTSHLPDPYDPTPILQGIGVYYTSLNIGGVDFAIVEDRKFKTGPAGLIPKQGPRPDHITNDTYDRRAVDVPEAKLLGDRQLKFLNEWGKDWKNVEMKAVLSQTIFAGGAHLHGKMNGRLLADLDSNGWPQAGRNRALRELRRCYALHIAGDQHLATVIHHGVNSWEDSGVSFCVPSIVNYYGRWWWPLEEPVGEKPESPLPFVGRYHDGLGNKVTMRAYANPNAVNHGAAGFGVVRFDKASGDMKMECWPRFVDVTKEDAEQFPGWPITVNQLDNYNREPLAMLPTLNISGAENPVVQVVDQYTGETVYTLRIRGKQYQPPVFREALYTINITVGEATKTLKDVDAKPQNDAKIDVKFE